MSGRIVTFYSYKGGSGRSMALANVAWILATHGKRVLAIDWDLEAPGLHRYFLPLLCDDPEAKKKDGLIDRLWTYVELLLKPKDQWPAEIEDHLALADPTTLAVPLELPPLPPKSRGALHFISAGKQTADYGARAQGFDWTAFYERFDGRQFIARMREKLIEAYDIVLVDSRTGITDTSGICTIDLPDAVIHCLVHNRQSVLGIVAAADSIQHQQPEDRKILQYPVPMRVEKNVPDFEGNRQFLEERLTTFLPAAMGKADREKHWAEAEILYRARYAGGEILAAFIDLPDERNTLFTDMLWLAHLVSGEKTLKPVRLDDEQRETYRRAVALRDPRIAELTAAARDPEKAHPKLIEWLAQLRRTGEDTPGWIDRLAQSSMNVARELANLGKIPQAMQLELEAIDTVRWICKDHPRNYTNLVELIRQYLSKLDSNEYFDDAISLYKERISIFRKLIKQSGGEYNVGLSLALSDFAKFLIILKDYSESERAALESLSLLRPFNTEDKYEMDISISSLMYVSRSRIALKNIDGAIEANREIINIIRDIKESGGVIRGQYIISSTISLIDLMISCNDYASASSIGMERINWMSKIYMKDPNSVILGYYVLISNITAGAKHKSGETKDALKVVKKALSMVRSHSQDVSSFLRERTNQMLETYRKLSEIAGTRVDKKLIESLQQAGFSETPPEPTPQ